MIELTSYDRMVVHHMVNNLRRKNKSYLKAWRTARATLITLNREHDKILRQIARQEYAVQLLAERLGPSVSKLLHDEAR